MGGQIVVPLSTQVLKVTPKCQLSWL